MNLTINSTTFNTDASGVPTVMTSIYWTATDVDGSVTGSHSGQTGLSDYAPANKPYADVTEQECLDWVQDIEDMVKVQAYVDRDISHQLSQTSGTGKPWQESYPLWAVGVSYPVDSVVIYSNVGYECIQAHTSSSDWIPPATPALWRLYVPESEGPQPWVQPTGGHDAYALGEQVTHNGHLWTSDVDDNVWEPGVSQWTDEGVYP